MNEKRRTALLLLLFSNIAIIATIFVYLWLIGIYDAAHTEPICNFQKVFYVYCPGCGGSRSLRALVRLDLISSFVCYPPLPLSLPILGYAEYLLVRGCVYSNPREILRFKPSLLIIPALLIVLNFIIRNILLLNRIDLLGDIL